MNWYTLFMIFLRIISITKNMNFSILESRSTAKKHINLYCLQILKSRIMNNVNNFSSSLIIKKQCSPKRALLIKVKYGLIFNQLALQRGFARLYNDNISTLQPVRDIYIYLSGSCFKFLMEFNITHGIKNLDLCCQ